MPMETIDPLPQAAALVPAPMLSRGSQTQIAAPVGSAKTAMRPAVKTSKGGAITLPPSSPIDAGATPALRRPRRRAPTSHWMTPITASISTMSTEQYAIAERLEQQLTGAGVSVLFDDRDASPGVKFADAELIGAPVRLTVGKRIVTEGTIDLQARRGREQSSMDVEDAGRRARSILQEGA